MSYFLDTNICIYYLKGTFPALKNKMLSHNPAIIRIPALVKAELLYGARKSIREEENMEKITRFLFPFAIAPFDDKAAEAYAELRRQLEQEGSPVGPNDMVIAAIVLANNGTLVTHNTREFSRIKNLPLEDWT